jgi:hypothetical protein
LQGRNRLYISGRAVFVCDSTSMIVLLFRDLINLLHCTVLLVIIKEVELAARQCMWLVINI